MTVRPWHLLKRDNWTEEEIAEARMGVCRSCDRFFKPAQTCKECGCIMPMKTLLEEATCPLGKW